MGDPILMAGDHRGVALKSALKERLEEQQERHEGGEDQV